MLPKPYPMLTTRKVTKERDMQLLSGFEILFYTRQGSEMEYMLTVLQGLCQKIKAGNNHQSCMCEELKGKAGCRHRWRHGLHGSII